MLGAALALTLSPVDARADPGEAERAIELGRQALDAYSRGAFARAREEFEAAERIAHSPVFVLYLARCDRALDKLLSARALLRSVAAETLAEDAPPPWRLAAASAHTELDALNAEIPSLALKVADSAGVSSLTLDGRVVDVSNGNVEIEVDPGPHDIEVIYRDGTSARRAVDIARGERSKVVDLVRAAAVRPRAAPSPAPAPPAASLRKDAPGAPLATWGTIALGAGAASLGVGVVSGIVALSKIEDVKDRCSKDLKCRPEDANQVESASDWASVSTLAFIAAGGFLTIGTTALFLSPGKGNDDVALVARGSF